MNRISLLTPLLISIAPAFAAPQATASGETARNGSRYELVAQEKIGDCRATTVKLVSQTWRGKEWWHWLSILVPETIEYGDGAILVISGGSSSSPRPSANSGAAQLMAQLASRSRAIVAVLQQVPNQPLCGDLYEDDLISYTFDRYLQGGDEDWLLLGPMVRSAVAAMDTVQSVLAQGEPRRNVKRFVVTGGSKRGWTTWLTAVADKRVIGIAPMVIDMLNMRPQLERQIRSYGKYSDEIRPYSSKRIPERMKSGRGRQLTKIVDPFEHRAKLTLPKLVVLGTNDPFWTVDASSVYFPELRGPKNLFYLPNAGHGLGLGIVPTLTAFFRTTFEGGVLPQLAWQTDRKDKLRVEWSTAGGKARLWHAASPTRDFRKAKWASSRLEGSPKCEVPLSDPESGWTASFVEVRFTNDDGERFAVATEVFVRPKRFPFALPKQK